MHAQHHLAELEAESPARLSPAVQPQPQPQQQPPWPLDEPEQTGSKPPVGPVWRTQSWEMAQQIQQPPPSPQQHPPPYTSPDADAVVAASQMAAELEGYREMLVEMEGQKNRAEERRKQEARDAQKVIDSLQSTIAAGGRSSSPPPVADTAAGSRSSEERSSGSSADSSPGAELARLRDDVARLKTHTEADAAEIKGFTSELGRFRANSEVAEVEREELEGRVGRLRGQLEEEEAGSAAYRDETAALRQEIKMATARAEIAEWEAAAAAAEAEAAKARANAAGAVTVATASRDSESVKVAELQQLNGTLRDDHATVAAALAQAEAQGAERLAAVEAGCSVIEDGVRKDLEEAGARLVASEERAALADARVERSEAAVDEFDEVCTVVLQAV